MAALNKVFLIGNLTRDPEIRRTPSGAAVGDLRLAVNRKFKSQNGEMRDETCFVNVTVWGRQAETCNEYLSKGSPLLVEGRLKYDEWEKEGQRQSRVSVVAERTQFLGAPKGRTTSGDAPSDFGGTPPPPQSEPQGPPQSAPQSPPQGVSIDGDDDDLPF